MASHAMILTEVTAIVSEERVGELQDNYAALLDGPLPDGLLRSELLRGPEGQWRIQTLWRNKEALDAMRSSEEPAAPKLFRQVGADPALFLLEVTSTFTATATGP
jgi:hypothetical protein